MNSKFFTFIKPYLANIDNGHFYRKPLSWLYMILAIINLLFPLLFFYKAAKTNIFDTTADFIIIFLPFWIIMAFAGWISFQIWWDRKSKILDTSAEGSDFVATPPFSHLIQTIGEWIGTWIGIVGFGYALLATIYLGDYTNVFSEEIGLSLPTNWTYMFYMPILGFLIIITTRLIAELFRVGVSIANNLQKN